MRRFSAAVVIASLLWIPTITQTATAIYCYSGDPPAVYAACLAYNQGIGAQVSNQRQLQNIQHQIRNVQGQIDALYGLIKTLNDQIAAQQKLITQTKAAILDLDRRIRLSDTDLTFLKAHLSERDQLLNQRLRYVDSHGAINYVQLVLTAASFNDLMNRMIGAQQVVDADQKLLDELNSERSLVTQATAALAAQRGQVSYLLKQQKVAVAALQNNQVHAGGGGQLPDAAGRPAGQPVRPAAGTASGNQPSGVAPGQEVPSRSRKGRRWNWPVRMA